MDRRVAVLLIVALLAVPTPAAADCRSACLAQYGCSLDDAAGRPGSSMCGIIRQQCSGRCSASPSSGDRAHGAIALGGSGVGFSWDYATQAQAEAEAVEACIKDRGTDCRLVLHYYDQCAAVAVSSSDIVGWDHGRTAHEARDKAIAQCKKARGQGCYVKPNHLKCSRY